MVPCLVHRDSNEYDPLYKPYKNDILEEKLQIRQTWLSFEDDELRKIVKDQGAKNWINIAKILNEKVHNGLPMRQGKQCRERWYNHLSPELRKEKWESTEDITIIEKHLELGNRWSEIASNLKGRTENQVKNRYKSLLRKAKAMTSDGTIEALLSKLRGENNEQFAVPKVVNEAMKFFPHMIFNVPTSFDSSLTAPIKEETPKFYHT
jgi:hypothetical protein